MIPTEQSSPVMLFVFIKICNLFLIIFFLVRVCRIEGCGARNDTVKQADHGGGLRVDAVCERGHKQSCWESCTFYNQVGTVLISGVILSC